MEQSGVLQAVTTHTTETLIGIIEPVVTGLDYEFVGLEFIPQSHSALLRIYIDSPDGLPVEACIKVSRHISTVLDVEWSYTSPYQLEVSSPGLDRILFTPEQMAKFIGQQVKVKLRFPKDGRRQLTGELLSVEGDQIVVRTTEGETQEIEMMFDEIAKARLVPQW